MSDYDTITLGAKILVVDATLDSLNFLTKTFREYGYRVRSVSDGRLALSSAQQESPDLILLDINIPGMSGYEICEKLKANEQTHDIPVIFISALHDILDKVRAFFVGGVDYITKPFQAEEVLARVETHLMLRRLQRNLQQKNLLLKGEIMEHRQTEALLKASEERYRRLVELSPEPIMVYQSDNFVYVNAAAVKLFAASNAEEFIGKPIMDFVHPDYHHLVKQHLQRISEKGKATALMEEKFVRLDGQAIDVEITGAPIIYQGKPATQVVMRDITKRKRMEDLLRKLQKAVETTDVGVAITDTEGRIVYINPAEATMHGYAVDELIGQRSDIFATPKRRTNKARTTPDFKKFLNWRRERQSVRKDGSTFPVKLTSNLIHDDKREVVGVVTICEDISERKQVEQSLKKSEGQYWSLIRHATIGIFQATRDGRFITANPTLARMLGYSSARTLIKRVTNIAEQLYVDPQHWGEITGIAQASREPISVETRCRDKDGREIIVRLNVWAVRDDRDQVRYLEGIIEDITEYKQTEEALIKSAAQIERAKKEWESTADSLVSVICLLDNQGYILRANRAIEQWNLGQVGNVKGQHLHDLFHPNCSDSTCYLKTLFTQKWEKLAQGDSIEFETQDTILQRYLSVQMRPILTQIGGEWGESASFAVCSVSDITERKHVEDLFTKSIRQIDRAKKEWESTADTLSSVICLLDNQGYIIRANRVIEHWDLGQVVDVKGRHVHDLLHPNCTDSTCYLNTLFTQEWKKLAQGESIECEVQDTILQRYLRVQMRPILAQSDKELKESASFAVCHIDDLTEHKQGAEVSAQSVMQIEQAKQEWESSADSLSSVMCVLDNQGGIMRANRTIEHWNLGRVAGVKGRDMHTLFHPNCTDPACYFKTFLTHEWKKVAQGESAECEAFDSILRRYLKVQIQPISAHTDKKLKGSVGFAVCTVSDITKSKQAEKALRRQTILLRGVTEAMRRLLVTIEFETSLTATLEVLGFVIEVDRIHMFETQYYPKTNEPLMSQRFTWTQEPSEVRMNVRELQNISYKQGFARWHEMLSTNKVISGLVRDFPQSERAILESQGVISILVAPIFVNQRFWGFIRFDDCQTARAWSREDQSILSAMAGSIGGAIARHQG